MRKLLVFLVVVLVSSTVLPVTAQSGMATCDPDVFTAVAEVLSESFLEFEELVELPDEPMASDFVAAVVITDAFAYGYWEGFYEALEEDVCTELFWLGYTSGFAIDEALILMQLSALAVYEAEAGNMELAETFLEIVEEEQMAFDESLAEITATMEGISSGDLMIDLELPACSEEELEATYVGIEIIGAAYEELGELTEEAEGEDLSLMVLGFGALSEGYWEEFMPEVPECAEAQDVAFTAGIILDDSLIAVSLLRLAEFEAGNGDPEVAALLLESALVRIEDIEAMLAFFEEE